MKLHFSKIPILDAENHQPNSAWWQFCILLRNMEDPRLSGGVAIFTAIQAVIIFALFTGAFFYWDAIRKPSELPKGAIASEQPADG